MTRSEFQENLEVALETLRAHKVRSGLTVLGIVIGITAVISVAAIIQGLNGYIAHRVEQMGSRTYMISRFSMSAGFGRVPEAIRKRKYLDPGYADIIRETCPSLESVSPLSGRPISPGSFGADQANEVTYGSERVERIILRGFEPGAPPPFRSWPSPTEGTLPSSTWIIPVRWSSLATASPILSSRPLTRSAKVSASTAS